MFQVYVEIDLNYSHSLEMDCERKLTATAIWLSFNLIFSIFLFFCMINLMFIFCEIFFHLIQKHVLVHLKKSVSILV